MRKCKLFFGDIKKEETWINAVQAKGYVFEGVGSYVPLYRFRKSKTGNYPIVKIDFRSFKKNEEYIDYIQLFNDYGWDHISGSLWSGEQYFRQHSPTVSEEIFSDDASVVDMKKRLLKNVAFLFILFSLTSLSLLLSYQTGGYPSFLNPKSWYLTPGLWQLSGWDFWGHFLSETPFVLFRAPLLGIVYALFALAYGRTYLTLKNR
ncbi:DUF2812 domain-containing protein [Streptococcus pluranimalium]|uniref:DUF2812 domain-containing protein n=1 Tax=Streptococcus pluranimalium TaxID=82348 RepID=UPI0039FBB41E